MVLYWISFFSLYTTNQGFHFPLFVCPTFHLWLNIWPWPLTPLKSMQRAASSDNLSMFSNADAQSHSSQHDVKQQLSHSQSMVLPENGKVFTSRAWTHKDVKCVYSRETHREKRKCVKTKEMFRHMHIHKYRRMNTADDVHLLPFSWSSSAEITPVMWPTSSWSRLLLRALQTAMAAHQWENTAYCLWNKVTRTLG